MMTDDQELFELYERFRRDIKHRNTDIYYDEDDLVIIFDLASDSNDTYTQLEVLMLGRRLFPASEQLALREGFMIDPDDDKAISSFLHDNRFRQGLIWEFLRLKAAHLSDENAQEALEKILSESRFDDDEEIIQFIELVTYYDAAEWFSSVYNQFIDRCTYRDTALNECARLLEDINPDTSIVLMEELSRIDPFNVDTWLKLGELYLQTEQFEEAKTAIEYAKAISPEDTEVARIESNLNKMVAGDYFPDEGNEEDILTPLATELFDNQNYDKALEILLLYDKSRGVYYNAHLLVQILYLKGQTTAICEYIDRERPEDAPLLRLDLSSSVMYAASLLRTGRYSEAAKYCRDCLLEINKLGHSIPIRMGAAGAKIALSFILDEAEKSNWPADTDPIAIALS